ncbi:16S rRNA (adenine(1518)-N(6)/adenine(1519)-N(6))-dimethyltransferase RsmA [Buchnera aphidicola]|uniref:16S rRNA (adenine(1518)-N(6)/adenine(1519)-N(6))- dimethyltransferase RsmA n=1 Tax=Buchnera aphidicola TaxID=9 RepID=UPI00223706E0|nr:16S rRNA (adenine(1518)-N(6)/adenine(1519)-N(6))-dimethyltransferase RsmA [Buchnera aphidicola]MCW5197638.1 16S rRNA (adenine(1518)-N(6)/adenine(1519)-N(6))-dimethyltransferase RsmA [Buchnera aphidicola (Chaitophorus viminalis)]
MIYNKKYKYKTFIPKKKFGQNFLKDSVIIEKIIKCINPLKNDLLIEVGPGLGALTIPICNIVDTLNVIDIDVDMLNFLKSKVNFSKINFFLKDVCNFNFLKFYSNNKKKKIRIFGNLPYNISTSLLINLTKVNFIIKDMYFMFQREVANRILSHPNSKLYGRLSILIQYFFKVKKLFDISPNSFYPSPKIYSTFLKFSPHKIFPQFNFDLNILSKITKIAFSRRRKILRNSLKNLFTEEILLKLNINSKLRAENLSLKKYCKLTDYLICKDIKNS